MTDFKDLIALAAEGHDLSDEQTAQAFELMMSGKVTPGQMGGFLMALRVKGETVDEISGGVRVMRDKAVAVSAPEGAIDTCGTGGDAAGTLNISTATAFVIAGCGVPVAKHGNKAQSSKSGSADVLAKLGVKLDVCAERISQCITEAGLGFMMAPFHHTAMRHVSSVRAELGTRTIFNLIGPLANPAGTCRQLVGVFAKQWLKPMAEVLQKLGSERVWVVHGSDGLDELTTTGISYVASLSEGKIELFEVSPEDAGLSRATLNDLKGGDADYNAHKIDELLDGKQSPYRDIVLLNSAAALIVADKVNSLEEGVEAAAAAIDGGHARSVLNNLVELTNN